MLEHEAHLDRVDRPRRHVLLEVGVHHFDAFGQPPPPRSSSIRADRALDDRVRVEAAPEQAAQPAGDDLVADPEAQHAPGPAGASVAASRLAYQPSISRFSS